MSSSNYQDLVVWQRARALAVHVYRTTHGFPRAEIFALSQQMRRAAVSIASNIAEGHGRRWPREVLNFLYVARGSAKELETQILIAHDLEFTASDVHAALQGEMTDVLRLLNGLIRHHEKKPVSTPADCLLRTAD